MKLKNLLAAFVAAVIFFTTSCNTSEPGTGTQIYIDIVTVQSRTETGSTFTCRKEADSPLVTYFTSQVISGNFLKEGDRILIQYTADQGRYVSGNINVFAATTTAGAGAQVPEEDFLLLPNLKGSVVSMNSVWRTGTYLNAVFLARSASDYKTCRMVADQTTLNDEYPVIRIIFEPETGADESNYAFYMSYSISQILSRPGVKGVRVYYNDPAQKQEYVQIEAFTSEPIRPVE